MTNPSAAKLILGVSFHSILLWQERTVRSFTSGMWNIAIMVLHWAWRMAVIQKACMGAIKNL